MPNGFESFMQGAMALGQRWQDNRDANHLATALEGYDKDPDAAIARATAEDPQYGMALHQQRFENKRQTQSDTFAAEDHASTVDDHQRKVALDGIHTLQGYLTPVAYAAKAGDKTANLGQAFDSMMPIMRGTLHMSADDIAGYRKMFTENPDLVLSHLDDYKTKVMSPGQQAVRTTPGGVNVLYTVPTPDKVMVVRGGDQSSHVVRIPMNGGEPSVEVGGGGGGGGTPPAGGLSGAGALNNPGGLKDGPWARRQPGYKGAQGGFAVFDSPQSGATAQETLLSNRYVGRTPETLLNGIGRPGTGYSPDSAHGGDNTVEQTTNYANYLRTHVGPGPYTREDVPKLAQAMREWETGNKTPGGGAPAVASGGAREVYSTPGKPTQFTQLSDQEVSAAGLNPAVKWQRGPDGKISMVGPANQLTNQANNPNSKAYQGAIKARAAFPQLAANLDDAINLATQLRDHPGLDHITGLMGSLPDLPGGQAANARALLHSLQGKIGIDVLQAMRSMSPTGAAMGRVTNYEMQQLQNSMTPLATTQGTEAYKKSLNSLIAQLNGMKGRMHAALPPDPTKPNQTGPAIHPQAIQMLRSNPSPKARQQFDQVFGQGMAAKVLGN